MVQETGSSTLENALPGKVGRLVDVALNKVWSTTDESEMSIVKNMVKWQNFLSVWRFYRKLNVCHGMVLELNMLYSSVDSFKDLSP